MGERCNARKRNDDCEDDLICKQSGRLTLTGESYGTCRPSSTYTNTDISSITQGRTSVILDNDGKNTGNVIVKGIAAGIPPNAKFGEECNAKFGRRACLAPYTCIEDADCDVGICGILSTPDDKSGTGGVVVQPPESDKGCDIVMRRQAGLGDQCSDSWGNNACRNGVCRNVDSCGIGTCKAEVVVSPCIVMPKRADLDEACSDSWDDKACKTNQVCNKLDNCGNGICVSSASGKTTSVDVILQPNIPTRQGYGQVCLASYGSEACADSEFSCIDGSGAILTSGQGICGASTSTVTIGIRPNQGINQACDVMFGANACSGALVCIDNTGNAITGNVGTGICKSISTVVVILSNQDLNRACDASYGSNACISSYICADDRGNAIVSGVGQGTCISNPRANADIQTVIIQEFRDYDEICDASFGSNACTGQFVCIGRNGGIITTGYGFCGVIIVDSRITNDGEVCDITNPCSSGYYCSVSTSFVGSSRAAGGCNPLFDGNDFKYSTGSLVSWNGENFQCMQSNGRCWQDGCEYNPFCCFASFFIFVIVHQF